MAILQFDEYKSKLLALKPTLVDLAEALGLESAHQELDLLQAESAADGAVTVHLKTDCEDMHAVSRSIFFAFAKENQALLELSVRKASLEDVFLELTESGQAEESEQYTEEPNETEVDA